MFIEAMLKTIQAKQPTVRDAVRLLSFDRPITSRFQAI